MFEILGHLPSCFHGKLCVFIWLDIFMLSTLGKYSADDILNFPENGFSHFMEIISSEMSETVFWGKEEKYYQYVIC